MHLKKMNFTKFLICLLVIFLSLAGLSIQAKEATSKAQTTAKQSTKLSVTPQTFKIKRLLNGAKTTGQPLSQSEPPTFILAIMVGLLGFVAFAPARFVHQGVQLKEKPATKPPGKKAKASSVAKNKSASTKTAKKSPKKVPKKAIRKPDTAEEYIDEIEAVAAIEEQLDAEESLELMDTKLEGKISNRGHKQASRIASKRKR
jgi:hypothetical protein